MLLSFERDLKCTAQVAFDHLTVPEKMNLWSLAKVEALEPGKVGNEQGARRRVVVPAFGFKQALDEEVLVSEPPHHFVYRVTGGGGLRNHRGELRLQAGEGGETHLLWQVSFEGVVPGLAPILGAILRPRLSASLDALARMWV